MLSGPRRAGTLIGVGLASGVFMLAYGAQRFGAAADTPAHAAQTQATAPTVAGPPAAGGQPSSRPRPPSRTLASLVPLGYRAISVQTTDEIAVSNLLQPGDVVDVQLVLGDAVLGRGANGAGPDRSEARTLLQAVRVVSVGAVTEPADRGERAGGRPIQARTMTLAMTPEQVNRFTLARSLGSFYLALRNPAEPETPQLAVATMPDLRGGGRASAAERPYRRAVRPAPARPASEGVELVVAGERQVIFPQ